MSLDRRALTYRPTGSTDPAATTWRPAAGFRTYESHTRVTSPWDEASALVLSWGIKRRSGFSVAPTTERVHVGERFHLIARVGFVSIREPVQVVAVVDEPDRVGFAYGTLEGHPVSGEEAFIVSRREDGTVWLTLRSLTRPGRQPWRAAFPLLLVAQRWYRRRYRRALTRTRPRTCS